MTTLRTTVIMKTDISSSNGTSLATRLPGSADLHGPFRCVR